VRLLDMSQHAIPMETELRSAGNFLGFFVVVLMGMEFGLRNLHL
jgi:hypothetical protein